MPARKRVRDLCDELLFQGTSPLLLFVAEGAASGARVERFAAVPAKAVRDFFSRSQSKPNVVTPCGAMVDFARRTEIIEELARALIPS